MLACECIVSGNTYNGGMYVEARGQPWALLLATLYSLFETGFLCHHIGEASWPMNFWRLPCLCLPLSTGSLGLQSFAPPYSVGMCSGT